MKDRSWVHKKREGVSLYWEGRDEMRCVPPCDGRYRHMQSRVGRRNGRCLRMPPESHLRGSLFTSSWPRLIHVLPARLFMFGRMLEWWASPLFGDYRSKQSIDVSLRAEGDSVESGWVANEGHGMAVDA